MDNITHSLVGAVIGQTGLKRRTRKGMAALVLGANGPDIDVFFGSFPWTPLATHRGFTHGIIGALIVMPLVVAGGLWLIDRFQVSRGKTFEGKPPMHFGWLLGLALIGCITHPLLDLQTTYAVQLLSPFSTRWYHTDTLFIIDLWLWLLLGGTLVWSLRREKRGQPWQRPAVIALAVMLAYIGANAIISRFAYDALLSAKGKPERFVASPPPFVFYRRDLTWLDRGIYGWASYDPLARPALMFGNAAPANMSLPVVRRAIALSPRVQRFLRWSIMPAARIDPGRCATRVTFTDARYMNLPLSRRNFLNEVDVPKPGPGCP